MTASLTVDRQSLQFTIMRIGNAKIGMKRAMYAAVRAAGKVLHKQARINLTNTEYTLQDLADLGHPYAKRHGTIQLDHGTRGGEIRDGKHVVHRQSGRLARALVGNASRTGPNGGPQYRLEVLQGLAPHWRYITQGTRRMLPRDPLWETAQAPNTIRNMRLAIVRVLGKELRSQASIRFAGPSMSLRGGP